MLCGVNEVARYLCMNEAGSLCKARMAPAAS